MMLMTQAGWLGLASAGKRVVIMMHMIGGRQVCVLVYLIPGPGHMVLMCGIECASHVGSENIP